MKRVRRWLLLLSLSGPIVVNLSCSTMFTQATRDAAISAVSSFVQDTTLLLLNTRFGLVDSSQNP